MTISEAWFVVGDVAVLGAVLLAIPIAVTSTGDDRAAPVTSRTVNAITDVPGDVPPAVTVTDCPVPRLAAFATYQISSSLGPDATLVAFTHVSPVFESTTRLTGAGAVGLRVLITATRRSPWVDATPGDAARDALAAALRAP